MACRLCSFYVFYCWRNLERYDKEPVKDKKYGLSQRSLAKVKSHTGRRARKFQQDQALYEEQGDCNYKVSIKKRPKCFFCNIFYKTRVILIKFGTLFPELTSEYQFQIGDFAPAGASWPKISGRSGRPLQCTHLTDGQTAFSSLYHICIPCSAVKYRSIGLWL